MTKMTDNTTEPQNGPTTGAEEVLQDLEESLATSCKVLAGLLESGRDPEMRDWMTDKITALLTARAAVAAMVKGD